MSGTSPESSQSPAQSPPPAPEVASGPALIDIGHFAAVDLRVGKIVQADAHPAADRLVVMRVDIDEEAPRQIVAGIRKDWSPEELVGRTIIVVANLKPAVLRGVESHGMLLAVRGDEKVLPLTLDGSAKPGTRVT